MAPFATAHVLRGQVCPDAVSEPGEKTAGPTFPREPFPEPSTPIESHEERLRQGLRQETGEDGKPASQESACQTSNSFSQGSQAANKCDLTDSNLMDSNLGESDLKAFGWRDSNSASLASRFSRASTVASLGSWDADAPMLSLPKPARYVCSTDGNSLAGSDDDEAPELNDETGVSADKTPNGGVRERMLVVDCTSPVGRKPLQVLTDEGIIISGK